MKLLLDTHVFLWFISGDARLSAFLRETIQDPDQTIYLSVVSVWEAIVKYQIGKLPLPADPATFIPIQRERHRLASLPLDEPSLSQLGRLPLLHRDPFDRALMAQALHHELTLVTLDQAVRAYGFPVLPEGPVA